MRWLLLLLVPGFVVLGVTARRADSSPFGHELWRVQLDSFGSDRWVLLDTGRIRLQNERTPVFLLGLRKDKVPPDRYHEMKVVQGRAGKTLWNYDGTGSDYVDASGGGVEPEGEGLTHFRWSPRLQDVDGDGSDDVVFLEQDFIYGKVLRAVRIEP